MLAATTEVKVSKKSSRKVSATSGKLQALNSLDEALDSMVFFIRVLEVFAFTRGHKDF